MDLTQQLSNERMDCIPEEKESSLAQITNNKNKSTNNMNLDISIVEQPLDFLKNSGRCKIHVYKKPTCAYEGCTKFPSFNIEGKKPLYCAKHKLEGMIYVIKNKKCAYEKCTKQGNYNLKGEKPLYCYEHKSEGMILVTKNNKCSCEGCEITANYNFKGEKPLYCAKHKSEGMIHLYKSKKRNLSESTNTRDNESLEEEYSKGETLKIISKKNKPNDDSMTVVNILLEMGSVQRSR